MALNLMTPRYVAPDVTKAALAGESLRSSRERTNLAQRAQQQREAQDAEGNTVRRAELGLKAEAQRVNLAGAQQAMRHKEEKLPFELRAMNASLESQRLKNQFDASSMEDRLLGVELSNQQAGENIANAKLSRELTREQITARQIDADKKRKSTAALAHDVDRAREMYETEDWQSLAEFVPTVGMVKEDRDALKANIASLLKDQEAFNEAMNQKDIAVSISKIKSGAARRFWRQSNLTGANGRVWTDDSGIPTPEGQAALEAYIEWEGLGLTDDDKAKLMANTNNDGQPILRNAGPAGDEYLNGNILVPSREALMEARELKAQQRAAYLSKFTTTKATGKDKYGYTITMANRDVLEGEEAADQVDNVINLYKANYADGASGLTHEQAFAKAMTQAGVADGSVAFALDAKDAAAKVNGGKVRAGQKIYLADSGSTLTVNGENTPTKNKDGGEDGGEDRAAESGVDPLPKDYDGPQGDVYDRRKDINQELTVNGMDQDLASWLIKDAADGTGLRRIKDNWEPDDDLLGLVEQGRRRAGKEALRIKELIAEALRDTIWADENDVSDAFILNLSKHIQKPIRDWPTAWAGKTHTYDIEEAATLRKEIPEWIKMRQRAKKLKEHMGLDVYKGQSKEY